MINLFVRFGGIYYISKAIQIWGEAQAIAMQLLPIADGLHEALSAANPAQNTIDPQASPHILCDIKESSGRRVIPEGIVQAA